MRGGTIQRNGALIGPGICYLCERWPSERHQLVLGAKPLIRDNHLSWAAWNRADLTIFMNKVADEDALVLVDKTFVPPVPIGIEKLYRPDWDSVALATGSSLNADHFWCAQGAERDGSTPYTLVKDGNTLYARRKGAVQATRPDATPQPQLGSTEASDAPKETHATAPADQMGHVSQGPSHADLPMPRVGSRMPYPDGPTSSWEPWHRQTADPRAGEATPVRTPASPAPTQTTSSADPSWETRRTDDTPVDTAGAAATAGTAAAVTPSTQATVASAGAGPAVPDGAPVSGTPTLPDTGDASHAMGLLCLGTGLTLLIMRSLPAGRRRHDG